MDDVPVVDRYLSAAQTHGRGSAAMWSYFAATYDADHDATIVAKEYPRDPKVFARLDKNHDGVLTAADFAGPTRMEAYLAGFMWARLSAREAPPPEKGTPVSDDDVPGAEPLRKAFARADTNHDGVVTEDEAAVALADAQKTPIEGVLDMPAGVRVYPRMLAAMDDDRSGTLSLGEVEAWRERAAKEADSPPPPKPVAGDAKPVASAAPVAPVAPAAPVVQPPRPTAPEIGKPAPDFTLKSPDGAKSVALSSLRGKPVALVFGSYTCPPFRFSAKWIRAAYDRYGNDVQFLFVYVREAHAIDGRTPMPSENQPIVEEPKTLHERNAVAAVCSTHLEFAPFVTLVDGIDDAVARAYMAPPARLYVVNWDGSIRYRSEPGPFGLKEAEFFDALGGATRAPRAGSGISSPGSQ
jgi:hypothetical protein